MSRARSGMWRSPITRMRKAIVPLGIIMELGRNRGEDSCLNGSYCVQGESAKRVELQQEAGHGAVAPGDLEDTRVSKVSCGDPSACLVVVCGSPDTWGAGCGL